MRWLMRYLAVGSIFVQGEIWHKKAGARGVFFQCTPRCVGWDSRGRGAGCDVVEWGDTTAVVHSDGMKMLDVSGRNPYTSSSTFLRLCADRPASSSLPPHSNYVLYPQGLRGGFRCHAQ